MPGKFKNKMLPLEGRGDEEQEKDVPKSEAVVENVSGNSLKNNILCI